MSMSIRIPFAMIVMTGLAACAGSGGGSGSGSVVGNDATVIKEVPFTSFSAVGRNQTAVMSGVSQTGSGTGSAFNLDAADRSNTTAKLTYDRDGNLSALSFSTPHSSVSFGAGDVVRCEGLGCGASKLTSDPAVVNPIASMVNPFAMGWNYQSFGVWMNDLNPGSFQAGAISAGAATPGSAVPTISSATFTGHAGGFYFDGAGGRFATDAQMSAVTNFQNRDIQFSTTGTLLTPLNGVATALDPSALNLSGNLNYASGTSQFSGAVNTQNGALTGNASGQFYGPNAQEIGGTYGLGSGTGASMVGGFGGKR